MARRAWSGIAAVLLALATLAFALQPALHLGAGQAVAPGVELFRVSRTDLLEPPGPVAVQMLRLDPRLVRLTPVLAGDQVLGAETVPSMARRRGAIAAINAGFFVVSTGEPAGLMKIGGVLVSDAPLARGAVAFAGPGSDGRIELVFDQVGAALEVGLQTAAGSSSLRPDGVDTTRNPGRIVWFNRLFNPHTDTTEAGIEWVMEGSPLVVTQRRVCAMRTRIPEDGAVLSFGGSAPPQPLEHLSPGDTIQPRIVYTTARGTSPATWDRATGAVGGAGLLVFRGKVITEWSVEKLRAGFATERHPRTMIGVDEGGRIWLITVDGRNPALSLGMSFAELQGLARGLGLRDALNLDGGGSTTMVVRDEVVNHPSDAGGPRKVSDAILVLPAPR